MKLAELKARIGAKQVDTVIVAFPDVFGRLIGKRLTGHHFLDAVAHGGTNACNYLLTVNLDMDPLPGFEFANWEKGYGDFELRMDAATIRLLPWQTATALVFCDLFSQAGHAIEQSPRLVLRRQLERARDAGFACAAASELEFFLFNQSFHEAGQGGYAALKPASDYRIDYHTMQPAREEPLMRSLRNFMDAARVPIESSKGEWGRGQHELNFVYADPLTMADAHTLFKQGAKEIADQQGRCITFMAKPDAAEVGSSCHIHMSLWQKTKNAFWDARQGRGSKVFRRFLGGLLKYSPELCYFFAPTINSYKRYQPASWAPTKMAWAFDNRTVGFRVVGENNSFRVENRMPGADANPYLAFAAMLAAGIAGIEENLDCGEVYEGNAYADTKLPALPRSLRDASALLKSSKLARKAFGDRAVDFYVHTARCEVDAFDNAVTDWERVRYFERI